MGAILEHIHDAKVESIPAVGMFAEKPRKPVKDTLKTIINSGDEHAQ
jgi:hypothetical protein